MASSITTEFKKVGHGVPTETLTLGEEYINLDNNDVWVGGRNGNYNRTQPIDEINKLKEIYTNLGGTDETDGLSKVQLLSLIAEVAHATLTSVTYAELTSLIEDENIISGAKYLITDYQTVHTIPNTEDVNTADVEPLVVTALAVDKLEPIAFSPSFPQDVIYYHVDNDQTMVAGCTKGYISRRVDTKQNNDFPFDFRNVKFRRWQIEVTTQDTDGNDANYTKGQIVKKTGTNELYFKLNDAEAKLFSDQSAWRRFEWDNLSFVACSPEYFPSDEVSWYLTPNSNYQDFHFFANPSHYEYAHSNKVESPSFDLINNSNTVVFGSYFSNNSIGSNFLANSIRSSFYNNSIGSSFVNNSIGLSFYNNSIGSGFNSNSIGSGFNSNSIGSNFLANSIGSDFYNNSIGSGFNSNSIGLSFYNNSIGSDFVNNSGTCNSVDFTTATHVYEPYHCQLYINNLSGAKIIYLDDDALTVVDADA